MQWAAVYDKAMTETRVTPWAVLDNECRYSWTCHQEAVTTIHCGLIVGEIAVCRECATLYNKIRSGE